MVIDNNGTQDEMLAQLRRHWARRFGVLTAGNYPNVNAYLARLETHPGFIKSQA